MEKLRAILNRAWGIPAYLVSMFYAVLALVYVSPLIYDGEGFRSAFWTIIIIVTPVVLFWDWVRDGKIDGKINSKHK